MRRGRATGLLALLLFASVPALAFAFLDLVFDRGDVYPPFSSLRSDPLGTRAFYEAVAAQPALEVSRLYTPLPAGASAKETVALFIGLEGGSWGATGPDELAGAETFLRAGGRLVLGFLPVTADPHLERGTTPEEGKGGKAEIPSRERWGAALRFVTGAPVEAARRLGGDPSLPAALPWRSGLRLELRGGAWTALYAIDGAPVAATRPFGRGTIVLLSDVSLLGNGSMRKERSVAFLASLVGDRTRVVFDETHLGVESQQGVMTLIRRFRLTGVVLAALLVAVLFVWRRATSLLPRRDDLEAGQRVSGRDSFEGLVRLLARGIPVSRLLPAALEEWSRTAGEPTEEMRRLAADARSASDVPAAWAAICRASSRRKETHA